MPKLRHEKRTDQVVLTLSVKGERRDYYLGPWSSEAAKKEYGRLTMEWNDRRRHAFPPDALSDLTIMELGVQSWGTDRSRSQNATRNQLTQRLANS